jgi:hypothetical protein
MDGVDIVDIEKKTHIEQYINGIHIKSRKIAGREISDDEIRRVILQHFSNYCDKGDRPIRAIARALQFALYSYAYPNNTPSEFCNVIGKRGGLVGPSGSAVKNVRLLIHRFALENLILSTLNTDTLLSGVELRELGELLRRHYVVLIGTDTDMDYSLLAEAKIAQNTPENLRSELSLNAQGIADMLIALGLARRYADGVTILRMEV